MTIAATYISASSFSVVGDRTSEFEVGRKVKCIHDGDPTIYGVISSSVYTSVTTIEITADTGDLTSNLTNVYYGVISSGIDSALPDHSHGAGDGGNITANKVSDFDTEVSNNTDVAANTSARHTRAHTMTSSSDHSGSGNWKVFYTNGGGIVTELALGADGTYLKSNGAAIAPSFATPSVSGGGDVVDDTTPQLGGNLDLNSKYIYGPYMANAADGTIAGFVGTQYTTDATSIGSVLYTNSSVASLKLADANGTGTYPALYMAIESVSGDNFVKCLCAGQIRNNAWNWSPGDIIYLSETAGGLTATAPTTSGSIVQVLGVAITADIIDFRPQLTWIEVA